MSEIVNLRLARKAKKRVAAERAAKENRVLHGRSKAEKQNSALEKVRAERAALGRKLDEDETNFPG